MRPFSKIDLQPETIEAAFDGHHSRLSILPLMGANLVSFQVDGREFIHFEPDLALSDSSSVNGGFQMFPTPCRLKGCRYIFQGREILQKKHGEDVFIHGLVRDEVFEVIRGEDELSARLTITSDHPVYEGFPFPGILTLSFRVIPRGMHVDFCFENQGATPAPAGYGMHPYWRIPGARKDVWVKIPCEYRMALKPDMQPTPDLVSVSGTEYDLREFRSLEGIEIDTVFYPKPADQSAGLAFPKEGVQLRIDASPNMKHMICYAPAGKPFVCVENLTCTPNAPNLYTMGYEELSGLAVVQPGERFEGWMRYTVESLFL